MKKNLVTLVALLITIIASYGQDKKADTVIVSLAKSSKVIFIIDDKSDAEILKHYDFDALFQDILKRLEEEKDTVAVDTVSSDPVAQNTEGTSEDVNTQEESKNNSTEETEDDDEDDDEWEFKGKRRYGRTWQSFNFDLGTNNYVSDHKFPDSNSELYTVKPWGSWYIALSSIQRTRLDRNFFLEWGIGLSWYNFKFENSATMIQKTDSGVEFIEDTRNVDHIKSKLTVNYINLSLVPVLDLGDHTKKPRIWDGHHSEFRVGLGPYLGYRIISRSKLVYKEGGGDKQKDKENDSLYLNNIRYGLRLQLGFRSTDLFFNYDLNELFSEGKGPSLNAFSFGVIF